MAAYELPCLDQLEATPEVLRGLMAGLDEEDARWKPAPDRFSIAEVLAHLSQAEGDYRLRLDRFMKEDRPELEPDDAQMHLHLYRNADPKNEFDHFEEQRENNIVYLRDLPVDAGERHRLDRIAEDVEAVARQRLDREPGPRQPAGHRAAHHAAGADDQDLRHSAARSSVRSSGGRPLA